MKEDVGGIDRSKDDDFFNGDRPSEPPVSMKRGLMGDWWEFGNFAVHLSRSADTDSIAVQLSSAPKEKAAWGISVTMTSKEARELSAALLQAVNWEN